MRNFDNKKIINCITVLLLKLIVKNLSTNVRIKLI